MHVRPRQHRVRALELDEGATEITVGVELDATLEVLASVAREVVGPSAMRREQADEQEGDDALHWSSPYGLLESIARLIGASDARRGVMSLTGRVVEAGAAA